MQDDFSKLWSKRLQTGSVNQAELFAELRDNLSNAKILNPNMRLTELAAALVQEADSELRDRLFPILLYRCYMRLGQAARKQNFSQNDAQQVLPGFEHLPSTIPTRDGKFVELLEANYRRLRDFYNSLIRKYLDMARADPQVQETRRLMLRIQPRAAKEEGITVRQVLLLEKLP
jgi:hypothetical protein